MYDEVVDKVWTFLHNLKATFPSLSGVIHNPFDIFIFLRTHSWIVSNFAGLRVVQMVRVARIGAQGVCAMGASCKAPLA